MKVVAFKFLDRRPLFTPLEALAVCKQMVKTDPDTCPHGKPVIGQCGHFTACNYGFLNLGCNAIDGWKGAPKKYRHHGIDKMKQAPAGALVFWSGGSEGFGHVGISDGKGHIFGTDLPTTNHFGKFAIDQVVAAFGNQHEPAGWTFPYFPLAGSDDRHPPKLSDHVETAQERVMKRLIAAAQDVIAAAKRGLAHDPSPELKAAYRSAIKQAREQIKAAQALLAD
jgi:hypothetical protein